MKNIPSILLCVALLGAFPTLAVGIDFDLNVHLGNRSAEPIIVSEPPLFLESAVLGLHVAVGTSHNMFHVDGRYFLFKDKVWLVAPCYSGPWTAIRHDRLPPGLAKRNYREILALRDTEYKNYQEGRYKGKTFRPGKDEERKEKGHGKDEERKDKGHGKEKRK